MGGLGNLQDPALLDDPYPTYRRLLDAAPVSWDDQHRMWLVLGHAEVLEAFRRPDTSVATAAARIRPALGANAARFERLITAISHFLTRVVEARRKQPTDDLISGLVHVDPGGQRIREGQTLFLLLGAANRDPRAFADPDRFDLGRDNAEHLGFGHGIHYCLGHALARLEATVALAGLVSRLPRLALGPDARSRRAPNFSLRGFASLPVTY